MGGLHTMEERMEAHLGLLRCMKCQYPSATTAGMIDAETGAREIVALCQTHADELRRDSERSGLWRDS